MKWQHLHRDPGVPSGPFWTAGKVVSGGLALLWVAAAVLLGGPADAFEVAIGSLVPILCIWTPEILAQYEGWGVMHGRTILRSSHASVLYVLGWVMLLLPAVQVGSIVVSRL